MVIRFACPHCQQRLTVSSRKAGSSANCPRCKEAVKIPAETAAAGVVGTSVQRQSPAAHERPPLPQIVVYEERPQLVYEVDESPEPGLYDSALVDFDRLSVPRWIVYLQGGLLAGVALFSFICGILLGNSLAGPGSAGPQAPQPCEVTGTITFGTSGGKTFPDDGAVVVAIPFDEHPDERAPVEGLRPEDVPDADARSLEMIRLWRGASARTDLTGRFRLRLPDRGKHFMLVISHHSPRSGDRPPATTSLQQMGRFFEAPSDLIAGKSYSWELKYIRGDMQYNKVFD